MATPFSLLMIEFSDNLITLTDFPNFDVKDTLECGQIFRYKNIANNTYEVFSQDKYALVTTTDGVTKIECDDVDYFYNFFDLNRDYASAIERISQKGDVLKQAATVGSGIRILNQDLTEMIFSFIISANNNIKRIQMIIERICTRYGKPILHGYAFPTLETLASISEEEYARLGAGYRARYLNETANAMLKFDIDSLSGMETYVARKTLLGFCGIGPKVADCILLFGMHRGNVFPVDTWIKKVYHAYFEAGHTDDKIANYLVSLFGDDSGLCQQYLFYFQRKSIDKSI
ncbi:MAG: hypothetical protein NC350_03690 [Corallococcus sp.]|nr:hypothetical protein [Corallococcus sp.]